jgi:chromosome segregation ATPase
VEAKSLIGHGEWADWLKENVNYSQSTANNYMGIFEEYGAEQMTLLEEGNAKNAIFEKLTYSKAVALLAMPAEEREEFIESNDIENMSTRELQDAIKARDEAENRATELKKQAGEATAKAGSLEKRVEDVLKLNKDLKAQRDKVEKEKQEIERTSQKKINDLQGKLNELEDIDADEEREKIRAEEREQIRKEMTAELEVRDKRIKELEVKASTGASEETQRFKVIYDMFTDSFSKLMESIGKMRLSNEETAEKFTKAIGGALERMVDKLTMR